jgi:HK97 gp10 family phage protein
MFTMRIEGGAQLAKALDQLSVRLSKKIVREALAEGGELIRKRASTLAPYAPGPPDIRENIGMNIARRSEEMAALVIGPVKGFAYGLPQEIGTIHHAAHPFMRPAFDEQAPKALTTIGQALWRELASRGVSRSETLHLPIETPDGGDVL